MSNSAATSQLAAFRQLEARLVSAPLTPRSGITKPTRNVRLQSLHASQTSASGSSRSEALGKEGRDVLRLLMSVYRGDVRALLPHYPLSWYHTVGLERVREVLHS